MLRIAIVAVAAAALAGAAASEEAPPAGDAAPVRTLEDRVSELKQRVQAPRERVRTDEAALGIRTVVIHRNEVGEDYWLESASYALDGEPIYVKTDLDGDLAGRTSIEVFDSPVPAGRHELTVELVFRGEGWGRGRAGAGERFAVRSTQAFQASGARATITVVAHGQGRAEPPALRFEVARPEVGGPTAP